MSYILCATDFKDAAQNAVQYAAGLCSQHGLKLVILHAEFTHSDAGSLVINTDDFANDMLKTFSRNVKLNFPDLVVDREVIDGVVVDGLAKFINTHSEPLLTIVGNPYNIDHPAFLSDNLMQIFKQLKCPVLAIPVGKSFVPPTKLCFAYDNHFQGSEDALLRIKNLVAVLQMELHLVIGSSDAFSRDNPPDINSHAGRILDTTVVHPHFLTPHNLDDSIVSFAEKNHMDWLAVMPRKHSFIENLIHKSHAQFMVNHAHIPVLAFHEVL